MRTIVLAAASASLAAVIITAILSERQRRRNKTPDSCDTEKPDDNFPGVGVAPETRLLSQSATPIVLEPGLVLLKGALNLENQLALARDMFVAGHGQRRWWCQAESRHGLPTQSHNLRETAESGQPSSETTLSTTTPLQWQLTGERQGRGRVYDSVDSFPASPALKQLCVDCVNLCGTLEHGSSMPGAAVPALGEEGEKLASTPLQPNPGFAHDTPRRDEAPRSSPTSTDKSDGTGGVGSVVSSEAPVVGGSVPSYEATHLLVLYYALERRLGWHRDDGPIDGKSQLPVVSVSLGNSCDFLLKSRQDETPPRHSVLLESGDVILFGGPARHILHAVSKIYPNTTPPELVKLQGEMQQLAPFPSFAAKPASGFRINLTFRHAPELIGQEAGDRFYHFASATRGFLATQQAKGTAAAREEAQARAIQRKKLRAEKKARKSAGCSPALAGSSSGTEKSR